MSIRILPGNVANMIAAGEVVQRPASVVKELMENAIDAGATDLKLIISDAGRTLIQLIDNGQGMSSDEAVLCFERHATSKIVTSEDLEHIMTLGFRGEALASIAAVAQVTLRTKAEGAELGTEVIFDADGLKSKQEVSCPKGANFSVRNLFYNIPARRKFLKSDQVELKHIVQTFIRIALTRPDLAFSLRSGDHDLFVLKPAKSLKFRIQDLMGRSVADELVELSVTTSLLSVSGYVGRPDLAKKTQGNQFFFVNGRYFRSPYLHKAVMKAYEQNIAEGSAPSYFLYLNVDPRAVDVNIHPTKTEVKFEDESLVFQTIQAAVREVLGRNSFGAGIDFSPADAPEIPVFGTRYESYRPEVWAPDEGIDETYDPFAGSSQGLSQDSGHHGSSQRSFDDGFYNTRQYIEPRDDYGKLFEDKLLPSASTIIFKKRYILTEVPSGLLVVNIRRAQERILYDKYLTVLTKGEAVAGVPLFPVSVELSVSQCLSLKSNKAMLHDIGFDLDFADDNIVEVKTVPDGFSMTPEEIEALLSDILVALEDDGAELSEMLSSRRAEKFALLGALHQSAPTTPFQAQALLDKLFSCSNSEYTSRGHRIMNIITSDEVDKKFVL